MEDSRRGFFERIMYGLWGLITAALAIPAGAYLLVPPRSRKGADWIEVGDLAQLPMKAAEEVVFRRNRVDGWKVTAEKSTAWLVKIGEKDVIAFSPQCTHLGCVYSYDNKKSEFVCPCHTSAFSLDGKVLMGPAPRPLDRYSVKIADGKVLIGNLDQPNQSA